MPVNHLDPDALIVLMLRLSKGQIFDQYPKMSGGTSSEK